MSTRRALITCVERYMGSAIQEKFEADGIEVVTGSYPIHSQSECEALVKSAGEIDILVVNLADRAGTKNRECRLE